MVNPIIDPSSSYMPTPTPSYHPKQHMDPNAKQDMGPTIEILDDDDDATVVTSNRKCDRMSGRDLNAELDPPCRPPPGFDPILRGNQYAALASDDEDEQERDATLVPQRGNSVYRSKANAWREIFQ